MSMHDETKNGTDGKEPAATGDDAGEDEGSSAHEGDDAHLHDDQKPITK